MLLQSSTVVVQTHCFAGHLSSTHKQSPEPQHIPHITSQVALLATSAGDAHYNTEFLFYIRNSSPNHSFYTCSCICLVILVSDQLRRHRHRSRLQPQRIHRIHGRAPKTRTIQRQRACSQHVAELVGVSERHNEKRQKQCLEADGGV